MAECLGDVARPHDQRGFAVADELIAAHRIRRMDGAGNGKHFAALIERQMGGDERARTLGRFHDQNAAGQTADDAVADGEPEAVVRGTGRIFADDRPGQLDITHQKIVLRGITDIQATGQHGNGLAACFECAAGRGGIGAQRHAGYDRKTGPGQALAEFVGRQQAIGRRFAGAHHAHAGRALQIGQRAFDVQHERRVGDAAQNIRIGRVGLCDDLNV